MLGKEEGAKMIAKTMIEEGLSTELIMRYTGFLRRLLLLYRANVHTISVSGNTLCAILGVAYNGLLQLCVVINPIMQIFFLFFGMVLSKYGLDYLFYGIF